MNNKAIIKFGFRSLIVKYNTKVELQQLTPSIQQNTMISTRDTVLYSVSNIKKT